MRLLGDPPEPGPLDDPELDLIRLRAHAAAEPVVLRRFVVAVLPTALLVLAFLAAVASAAVDAAAVP